MPQPEKPKRVSGLAHFFAAAGYSVGGLRRVLREAAFRQEALAVAGMAVVLWLLQASLTEFLVFLGLSLLVFAIESLNTAIEVLVDQASPGWAQFAKEAKDLGSFAVMCGLLCHGVLLAHVILT